MKLITSRSRTYGIHIYGTVSAWWCHATSKGLGNALFQVFSCVVGSTFQTWLRQSRLNLVWTFIIPGICRPHKTSWFSLSLHFTHSLISFILILCPCQTTALDKERQVFRRRRNQDVRGRYKAQQAPPELNSESEDYSPSSSETVRSPNSPF